MLVLSHRTVKIMRYCEFIIRRYPTPPDLGARWCTTAGAMMSVVYGDQRNARQQQPIIRPTQQQATKVAHMTAIPASKLKVPNTLLLLDDCVPIVVVVAPAAVVVVVVVVVVSCVTMTPIWFCGTVGTVLTLPGATVPAVELEHVSLIGGTTHSPPLHPVLYDGQAEQAAPGMYGCGCPTRFPGDQ